MSDEDKELLARIGQLAGQINRHKNRQSEANSVPNHHPAHHRHNNTYYRNASAPYPARGNRVQRPRPHQHRSLQFSNASSGPSSGATTPHAPSGFIARNDRHRQLINANVYEKDTQNRAKAMEATRKKKAEGHRSGERHRFNEYLARQNFSARATTSGDANPSAPSNELTIEGVRFRVLDGGKKLSRVPGQLKNETWSSHGRARTYLADTTNPTPTPKSTVIAGVKFYRTKTGNLVVNRVVKNQRRSAATKKVNEPCKIFSTSGSCPKGPQCRFIHDPNKVALCKDFLKEGRCANGDACDLSHDMSPERVPNCLHYAKGNCAKAECPFTHSKAPPSAPVCRAFGFLGFCEKGADCTERHVFECPDFSNTGKCNNKRCKLLHRERASVLRGQMSSAQEPEGDISSDDGAADSDDVDSDDVAEFIDADSDESDIEDRQDFIKL